MTGELPQVDWPCGCKIQVYYDISGVTSVNLFRHSEDCPAYLVAMLDLERCLRQLKIHALARRIQPAGRSS